MIENLTHYCVCRGLENLPPSDQALLAHRRAALLTNSRWETGSQISIRFLDGDPALQAKVKSVALEWTGVANLDFVFLAQGPADIRISFAPGNGSWSYIGTVCREIEEPLTTMNYGWLTLASEEAEIRRVVLHEFGHAIGLIHEHQNPKGGIKWNEAAVIHDLSGPPNNWDAATIDANIFRHYSPTEVVATDVDSNSIMMYPIPRAWTIGGFSAGLNNELSDEDKALVRSAYPR
jgi:serralysin